MRPRLSKQGVTTEMQLERFTLKSQEALAAAQRLAQERGHAQVEPEHLAAALLDQEAGLAVSLFERIGARSRAPHGRSCRSGLTTSPPCTAPPR